MSGDQMSGDQTRMEIICECAVGGQMRMEIECPRSNVRDRMSRDQMSGDQMRMKIKCLEIKCPEIKREWRLNVRDQMRMEIKRDLVLRDQMSEIKCPEIKGPEIK